MSFFIKKNEAKAEFLRPINIKKDMSKPPIRIALSGDRGRMGLSLQELIEKSSALQMIARANRELSPNSWPAYKIDGVVDFSLPELFSQSLKWAVAHKKPFVSGTTGLSARQKSSLKTAGQTIPVFYSENMSGGIFLLSSWMAELFDSSAHVLIEDIHHKGKLDRPSGTALRLKRALPAFLHKKTKIKSLRKGNEFGTHRLIIQSQEETLTLEHKALNRKLFARGALQALLFIMNKTAGLYGPAELWRGGRLSALP